MKYSQMWLLITVVAYCTGHGALAFLAFLFFLMT